VSGSYVVLAEADAERLGCVQRLPYDLAETTAREQVVLQKAFGYHSPADVVDAMRAMPIDEKTQTIRRDPDVFLALTWLGLRQGGHLSARGGDAMAAELADLDIKLAWTLLDFDVEAEGKDESSTPTRTSTA
jgi:hypothetical protein